jgi:hypothetical protein
MVVLYKKFSVPIPFILTIIAVSVSAMKRRVVWDEFNHWYCCSIWLFFDKIFGVLEKSSFSPSWQFGFPNFVLEY